MEEKILDFYRKNWQAMKALTWVIIIVTFFIKGRPEVLALSAIGITLCLIELWVLLHPSNDDSIE